MLANKITLRSTASKLHPTEFKVPGQSEYLVGRNGEINASNKGDLLRQIYTLATAASRGELMTTTEQRELKAKASSDRRQLIIESWNNPDKMRSTGAAIGAELSETANRDGFMRRFFMRADVAQGTFPRIKVNYKTQFAVAASSTSMIHPVEIRNRYLLPPEFTIGTHMIISEIEIYQSPGDILEEKMIEGNEAVMVQEDKVMKRLLDAQIGVTDNSFTLIGGLTPQVLQSMRTGMMAWNLPVDNILFAMDYWDDLLTTTSFQNFYDPVSQYEIVQTGYIGRLLGMNLISDSFREPKLKVLGRGELYLTARADFTGAYTDRGPVSANEINNATNGKGQPARGWFLYETVSMVASNSRAVVRATR